MEKKLRPVPSAMPLATVAAVAIALVVTGAFAIAGTQKSDADAPGTLPVPASAKPSVNVSAQPQNSPVKVGKQIEKEDDENDGEEEDGEENDGPLTAAITPDQARAAALAAQPGTATKVELEKEDGVTVYGVDITAADSKKYDVKVDATTGKVLKSDADDEDGEEEDGPDGDGDGEENDGK